MFRQRIQALRRRTRACGRWTGLTAAGLAATVVLSGCAAAPPPPEGSSIPTAAYEPTSGVQTMADLGWSQGPAAWVPLPGEVRVTQRVDQANVITASFDPSNGDAIAAVLQAELPAAGWVIQQDAPEAVLFDREGWQGAFTRTDAAAAITIRAA